MQAFLFEVVYPRIKPWLPALLVVLVAMLGFEALQSLTREIRYSDVLAQIHATPRSALLLSALFTALSFVALAGYDASGLAYIGAKLPARSLALGSFAGYALGNTVGMGVLTGGAVRFRVYGAAGLSSAQVARLMAFVAAGFGGGITAVGALGLLWGADRAAHLVHVPPLLLRGLALLVLAMVAVTVVMCMRGRKLPLFGHQVDLPSGRLALTQLLVSALDIAFAAAALWVLIPPAELSFGSFIAFYALAVALGVISHIPAGVGVFEAVMLLAYRGALPTEQLAGALVLYRAIYYLLPLALAVLLLVAREAGALGASFKARERAAELAPLFLSVATYVVGVMLLVSGVTPSTDEATELLALNIPLSFVEGAHFLGSVAGLGLLFIARGLQLRLDAAWWAAVVLAAISILFALPKGIAIGEMSALATLVTLLLIGRREFDRRASLFHQPLSWSWWLTVGVTLGAIIWLMFFVYRDVDYANDLWWQFTFDGHAPRALRATLAVVIVAFAIAARQAFRPASVKPLRPTSAELDRAYAIVQSQGKADAMLALMGDKSFLFSASGNSFVMYGQRNRTWAALYDPIGPESEWPELIWNFVELAATHGGRACFYQASVKNLGLYVDVGLSAYKLGEYAYVPLKDFTLAGSKRAHLRQAIRKGEREGMSFELLVPEAVPAVMADLQRISDAWLATQNAREKSFSLGAFSPAYLGRTPVAIARKDGQAVAFANLMVTGPRTEATVDLMRYTPDAPRGVMDYLFVSVMLHCQAQGYDRFGLGMAPLSGMSEHQNAPRWQRLGRLIYRHGEHFYNFKGLRFFKEKFDPQWEPRYLVAAGGVEPLLSFTDVVALVSGGLTGVVSK